MNTTWYLAHYYNEHHISVYQTVLKYFGPTSLVFNAYGLYLIIFHSATHLKFLRTELVFHQIALLVFDLFTFDAGKIIAFFPVPMGYCSGWLATTNKPLTCVTLSFFFLMWATTCSTILRILIKKHQNLWPPGSKWKLTAFRRNLIFAYIHLCAIVLIFPTMVNGLNFEQNRQAIATRYPFIVSFMESPYVFVLDDEKISFTLLLLGIGTCVSTFGAILNVTIVFAYVALRRSRHQYSEKTYRMQIHYLTILVAQMSAPLFFSILPCILIGATLFARLWVPIGVNIGGLACAGLHGTSSTAMQIVLNKCYRDPSKNLFLYPLRKIGILNETKVASELTQATVTTRTWQHSRI